MKLIRRLIICIVLAAVFVAVVVAVAFVPVVQTWIAQFALASRPGVHASLGSFAAGIAKVDLADLQMEVDGAVLTLPSLQARLPLKTAVWEREIVIRSLVAKGWTLDLSRVSESAEVPPQVASSPTGAQSDELGARVERFAAAARMVVGIFRGIFRSWKIPCDVTLDGVDLEGDIVIAMQPGSAPARVHVRVTGGGLATGHNGVFAIAASVVDLRLPGNSGAAQGRLLVAMTSPRKLSVAELNFDFSAHSGTSVDDLKWSVASVAARSATDETTTINLTRGNRPLATLRARFLETTQRLEGTWKIDFGGADFGPFTPENVQLDSAVSGEGEFDADGAFAQVHLAGHLSGRAKRWGAFAPQLAGIGDITLTTQFDLARRGHSIRFGQFSLSLAGARPVAEVNSLRPFDLDERTGEIKVIDPHGDWIDGSIRGFPLAWLTGLTNEFAFDGAATGDFVILAVEGGYVLRPKKPLVAAGVTIARQGRTLGQGLDASLSVHADWSGRGWNFELAPLTLDEAGRRLVTIEAKASRPSGNDHPVAISGTWSVDLPALAAQPAIAGMAWLTARSASGDFSGTVGSYADLLCTLSVIGHDPTHTLSAKVRADIYSDGTAAFVVPVKIAFGKNLSDVSADVSWSGGVASPRVDLKLTAANVALDHLRLLAAPVAFLAGGEPAVNRKDSRDRIPFWGAWVGGARVELDRLRTADRDFVDVGGYVKIDAGALHLEGGHVGLAEHSSAQVEGSVAFDPAAEFSYNLKATAAFNELDATPLFASPKKGEEPLLEGRFAVAGTFTGNGVNLGDLIARTQEEYRFTSKTGIFRMLRTDVAQSLPPPPPSPVSDALGSVGSLVGKLFGVKEDSIISAEIPVSPTTQAVLDLRDAVREIGYDSLTVTATREFDGKIHLVEFELIASEARLAGTGQITPVKGLSLFSRPLSMDLTLGARGHVADLLGKAGLLSAQKDKDGYSILNPPIHFGGALERIDQGAWHDLLVKAARSKPMVEKRVK